MGTGDPQLRNSVMVQSDAAKGAFYASMVVFGGTTVPTVQLLGRDSMQPYNGGAHPWTTAAGETSTLVMFNYANAAQPFYVAISAGTALWQQLAALETKTLDIGSLIAAQTRDENGHTLPANSTAGVARWFTPNVGQGSGRLLLSQPSTGLARNFGCQTAMSFCGVQADAGGSTLMGAAVTIAVGSSGQMGPYEAGLCMSQIGTCGGSFDAWIPWAVTWFSGSPAIASVSAGSTPYATIGGISAGETEVTAMGAAMMQWDTYSDSYWTCYAAPQIGRATVTAACASITNFTENFVNSGSDGTLYWNYTWSSSTGKQSDLAACSIGETVYYPGTSNPYVWPAPMVSQSFSPTLISSTGSMAGFSDRNLPPTSYSTPYYSSSFNATQRFWWHCPCYQNDTLQNPVGDRTITRQVSQGAYGKWTYQITKSGQTATASLP